MSFYIILYGLIFISYIFLGISLFSKYKNLSGYYFLIFCLSSISWLTLYVSSFFIFTSPDILYLLSQIAYFISIISIYSFILFIYYFNNKESKKKKNKHKYVNIYIHILFICLGYIYIFTPGILSGMYFDIAKQDYYETPGILHNLHVFITLLFLPIFYMVVKKTYKNINFLSKLRLKYILLGAFVSIFLTVIFQLILPMFDIRMLEKEIGIFFSPFIILTFYAIHKYNLSNITIKIGELIVMSLALFITIFGINILKHLFTLLGENFSNFWEINNHFGIIDILIGVVSFTFINKFLYFWVLGFHQDSQLFQLIMKLKKEIPYITSLHDLNNYLELEYNNILKIKQVEVVLFKEKDQKIYNFFQNNPALEVFINDIVFIQENKNKYENIAAISKFFHNSYLIYPLYDNKNDLIGYFSIGKKPFQEHYYKDEISIFKDFKIFLEGHLKYIQIYKKIHLLSVNLDKQVDKQTIEYNQLINKQKEFINVISHEVKGPIASSIFQIDNIIDDYKNDDLSKQEMQRELFTLNELLLKTGDLVNKLFSIQQFEMNSKSLFVQNIKIVELLKNEVSIFQKIHPEIVFHTNFDEDIQYIPLDKVQFKQVIDNLISNAIKIIDPQSGEIFVSCKKIKQNIQIVIEDNGKGFSDIEIKKIFDKYVTGSGSGIGLGMGLYLCKTIVELHGGNIQASFGKKLGGARIIIIIPSV